MPPTIDRRQLLLGSAVASALPAKASGSFADRAEPPNAVFDLWPQGAPGGEHVRVREEIVERSPDGAMRDRFARHVTRPNVTLFAPKAAWNGVTLLLVPGGGYVRVVMDKEGYETAEWLAARGFAAAVLRYRLPADGWASGPDVPIQDARRALRILRHRRWPGEARRMGVIGFSAGGHVCGRLITETPPAHERHDEADDVPDRVDFAALVYPVIAMTGDAAHAGSAQQIVAAGVSPANLDRFSPHRNVTARTPRTLLVHATDDTSVPVENSLLMYQALRQHGVPGELHVFDRGGHGFGMRGVAGLNVAIWPTLVENWALSG